MLQCSIKLFLPGKKIWVFKALGSPLKLKDWLLWIDKFNKTCSIHFLVLGHIWYFILFYMLIMHTFHTHHTRHVMKLSRLILFKNKNENLLLNHIVLKIFTQHENNFLNPLHDYTSHYINSKIIFLLSFFFFFSLSLSISHSSFSFSFFSPLCPTTFGSLSLHYQIQPPLFLTPSTASVGGPATPLHLP